MSDTPSRQAPTQPESGKPKILPLQVLRGLLALVVAVGHSLLITDLISQPFGSSPGVTMNYIGLFVFQQSTAVVIFFVISGYVLMPALSRQTFPHFLLSRAVRLWPVAWASIALGILYVLWVPQRTLPQGSGWFNDLYSIRPENASVLLNGLLVDWDFNGVLWSIYVEATAALFLPLLFWAKRSYPPPAQLALWIALMVVSYIEAPTTVKNIYCFLHCFFIGMYIDSLGRRVGALALYFALGLLMLAEFAMTLGRISIDTKFILNTLCAFVVVSYVVNKARAAPKLLVYIGDISYSFYAVHLLVMHAVALLIIPAIPSRAVGNWAVALLSVAISLPLAIAIRQWVEKPALVVGCKLKERGNFPTAV